MKLQVGILSMQKVINYGSFLQAYALKKIIETFNAEVYFVDIKPGEILPRLVNKPAHNNIFKKVFKTICCGMVFKKIIGRRHRKKRDWKFQHEFFKILGTNIRGPERFDVIVIGSDEVFNACNPAAPWGFTTQLFGDGLQAKRVITYAASFGHTVMDDIEKYAICAKIKSSMKNISKVSVRDQNSFDIVKKLTNVEPKMNFDPVLVYEWPEIGAANPLNDGYIIVYSYRNRISTAEKIKILDFAKSNNKKLLSLYEYCEWCDKNIIPKNPFEVLTYFKFADYIVTDTFHGTIFSVINKKPFCTIVRSSNKNKIDHLLEDLGLTGRKALTEDDIGLVLGMKPDFSKTDLVLDNQKKATYSYLKECLSFEN